MKDGSLVCERQSLSRKGRREEEEEEQVDAEEGDGGQVQPERNPADTNADDIEEDTTPRPVLDDDERADDTSTENDESGESDLSWKTPPQSASSGDGPPIKKRAPAKCSCDFATQGQLVTKWSDGMAEPRAKSMCWWHLLALAGAVGLRVKRYDARGLEELLQIYATVVQDAKAVRWWMTIKVADVVPREEIRESDANLTLMDIVKMEYDLHDYHMRESSLDQSKNKSK
ncbi:uncharacterized protein Z518_07586 [Rhinocladiella mackenziei CBS 650.93]|uniref:Uncharacterized protein n=1 Tax=Rhinocladiella mackenziei CBS 650.93 TaxID=1442369 RepID=A0A0D2H0T9_9EURO|nr:uncharacterized protein Z518_07586 [Rhinocladiella mackenziei CBS 650.93]KIX04033.1 hypothetical protein Z518_07586 [Rhinocladiella mackenziei CBS 650.93]